jgi:hypothetical protein
VVAARGGIRFRTSKSFVNEHLGERDPIAYVMN